MISSNVWGSITVYKENTGITSNKGKGKMVKSAIVEVPPDASFMDILQANYAEDLSSMNVT